MEYGVWGRVQELRVWGLEFGVLDLVFGVWGRVQEFGVEG